MNCKIITKFDDFLGLSILTSFYNRVINHDTQANQKPN